VHPDRKGHGIGSTLLDAVIKRHCDARAIRLEVLRANAAAIAWYQAKGFEVYGHTANATGTANVPALYMDKQL
jgi:ribosomal protein S18 acetylase RimI-like enzyme